MGARLTSLRQERLLIRQSHETQSVTAAFGAAIFRYIPKSITKIVGLFVFLANRKFNGREKMLNFAA